MKKTELKRAGFYLRKRDKELVHIEKFGSLTVTYVTHPLLVQWARPIASFLKGFRPATAEEIKRANPDMSVLPTSTKRAT